MTPEQLKNIRKARKLSQQKMAEILGFASGRYVRALESGERAINPRTAALAQLKVCPHDYSRFTQTQYKGEYSETCRICGHTHIFEKDYT